MNYIKATDSLLKANNHNAIVEKVVHMLDHFKTYNFITTSENNILQFDFNGETLKQIIKNEWLLSNTVYCDQPAFCFNSLKNESLFKEAFHNVRNLVSVLPFSFIEINSDFKKNNFKVFNATNAVDLVRNQFKSIGETTLRNQTFCLPQNAVEFFHKLQRERKTWWRKFSAEPGRFYTSEVSNEESAKSKIVEIKAKFPWGSETVELIKYLPEVLLDDQDCFQIKNQRKVTVPQIISCETTLEKITLTYLCDSFEMLNENSEREMMRFSRKLAPYKVAFAISGISIQNLKDLATLLAKKLRKCGTSILILSDMSSATLERQFLRNDALGIPFTIILNETTLKDGIISIRSRDTTLKEQSHVSLIVPYIEKLIKNY